MSCGKHTTRRQAHATRRAKTSHTVRKAAHNAARQSTTNKARKATSAHHTYKTVRRISKTRPKATKSAKAPKRKVNRKLTAAQLKARNRRHRILSKRARAHATAVARAKARAGVKAAASRRAAQQTARSHNKGARFYCRVATRHAAKVTKARSGAQAYNRAVQKAHGVKTAPKPVRGQKAATKPKAPKAVKAAKGG